MEICNLLSNNLKEARSMLTSLGATANYTGFEYAAWAIALAMGEPKRLLYVTKMIYPDVAMHCGTNSACVERCIRTLCSVSWKRNAARINELAGYPLSGPPSNGAFIAILAEYLSGGDALP